MISVKEAQDQVLNQCSLVDLGTEIVPLGEALGKTLAADVFARDPLFHSESQKVVISLNLYGICTAMKLIIVQIVTLQ